MRYLFFIYVPERLPLPEQQDQLGYFRGVIGMNHRVEGLPHGFRPGVAQPLVVLINMPVMSGPEFLVALAKFEQADKLITKVVVLSSSSLLKDQHLIGKYQVVDFIQKPLTAEKVDLRAL